MKFYTKSNKYPEWVETMGESYCTLLDYMQDFPERAEASGLKVCEMAESNQYPVPGIDYAPKQQ
jgi:hypothetical protein